MYDHKKSEDEVLKFWKAHNIYEKVKAKNKRGKKFYMMDGPPYATGHIHMGTALNKVLKDIAMRSKRLQGYNVFDRPGYDTHGLPIEFQVEKEIGSKSKKDIETYGIKRFVEKCRKYATKYIDLMNSDFNDLGVWMEWDNPYLTLSDDFIEAVWHVIKIASEKKLLYLDKYPVHLCPRCETAVAYNEIEYAKENDTSIFVKFPIAGKELTYLIIWTTTPWTLPGNTGIMANPEVDYQKIELDNGEKWIIAKKLVQKLMDLIGKPYVVKEEFKGRKIEGLKYEHPLGNNLKLDVKNGYRVVLSSRYVKTDEGTGLVHCAPGHGKEDYEVGKEYGLDMPSPVKLDGSLTDEAGKYAGKKARVVDIDIIEDLRKGGYLVYSHKYSHDYPHCWRCRSALLMVSHPQWFLKISEIHNKLIKENEKTDWIPDYMQHRMKAWLEGIDDWPISRERYWGTPLPIWVCDACDKKIVVGSIKELKALSGIKKIGLHKPEVDKIEIECNCGGKMKRISSVFDVWFDSGVSSWAALGYPSSEKEFKKFWPADFNIEGKDQFRGWWNSQLILSVIEFGNKPFESVAVHGMILDFEKRKMSKSQGNAVSPSEVVNKFGRDFMRYYFAKLSRGEDFSYNEKEFIDIGNMFRVLINLNRFAQQAGKEKHKLNVEDRWIISRYNSAILNASQSFNRYRFYEALGIIEDFLVVDVSRIYIQIIRERAEEVYSLIREIMNGVLRILSPIIPFITENIWQDFRANGIVKEESVHLSDWPRPDKSKIDKNLEEGFKIVLEIIERGLSERDKVKIGLKWPLKSADITIPNMTENIFKDEFYKIIANQLNVKDIAVIKKDNFGVLVKLDVKQTPELEAEGYAREIARHVQAERKRRGLQKSDSIGLVLSLSPRLKKLLPPYTKFVAARTGASEFSTDGKSKPELSFGIKDEIIGISFTVES